MKYGAFGIVSDYEQIRNAGYDYAEFDMPEIEALSDREYEIFRQKVAETGFPILVGSRLFPITTPAFFHPGFRSADWEDYIISTCRKSAGLGIRKIILGNGKARMITDERERGKDQIFVDLIRMICDIAGENGLELILEPLGPEYSNYINTLPEAVEMVKRVNMPNVYTMADLRHMVRGGESFDDLISCSEYIHHVHIDYPLSYPERMYPCREDDYDYGEFFRKLRESGYDGTVTVEADRPDDWDEAFRKMEGIKA